MKNLFHLLVLFLFIICLSSTSIEAQTGYGGHKVKPRLVRCRDPSFGKCFLFWFLCPPECPRTCLVDCGACKPVCSCNLPGAVCQDPRFVGGDGITFYFHGRKDQDFCLVSDTNLHINAHFIGKRNPKLKRDFTWVQSIAVMFNNHKLHISAMKTSKWDKNVDRIILHHNNVPILLPTNEGAMWQSLTAPLVTFKRTSNVNGVLVEVDGIFRVKVGVVPITPQESRVHGYNITDEDCFAHLELGFKFYNLTNMVDGVLGQTYSENYVSKANLGTSMPVLGGLHKYLSSNIFSTDCPVTRFGVENERVSKESEAVEYASLSCSSGMTGAGMVCKR
ncbi:Root cap [Dillenia turbinata]|uniref:Root cap n=1 Tax=Dillenia turbinata TaxID=194707 RepID=A0AAN8VFQ0_9MAGN